MDDTLPYVPVSMLRHHLDDIPFFPLPHGYTVRRYQPGDERHWVRMEGEADGHNVITSELFTREFGTDPALLAERQYFLLDPAGEPIGTATAWFNDSYQGLCYGRVHWVAIVPAMQGQGLARPLMTVICTRLRELGHERAYLTTEAVRLPAIQLYLKFGFVPEISDERDQAIWDQILRRLRG